MEIQIALYTLETLITVLKYTVSPESRKPNVYLKTHSANSSNSNALNDTRTIESVFVQPKCRIGLYMEINKLITEWNDLFFKQVWK